jgi:hypothetical protein
MPYTAPTVNYSATPSGTYTTLTGVESVIINRGKKYFQDPYPQSTCVIELIPANSYTLAPAIGQFLDVRDANSATSPCYFSGQIIDVERKYAIPYNSVTGSAPADRIVITATGALGVLGTDQKSVFPVYNASVAYNLNNIGLNSGVTFYNIDNPVDVDDLSYTGGTLDLVNTLLRTAQLVCDDVDKRRGTDPGDIESVLTYQLGRDFSLGIAYGDTGAPQRFKQIEYLSSVQNTFTKVQVVAPVSTATATSGSAPYNALVYNTLNATAGDVSSLAGYLVALLSGQLTPVPYSIETDTTVSASCTAVAVMATEANLKSAIGQTASITFRGSTVSATVQGMSVRFYPDRASVQLWFSPTLGSPFTLDSSALGVLDTNRLGYP